MQVQTTFARLSRAIAALSLFFAGAVPVLAIPPGLTQEAKLLTGDVAGNQAASAVALSDDGKIAVVGAPGNPLTATGVAYVYTRSGTTWTFLTTLTASDAATGDQFGAAVSISGNSAAANIAIGAPGKNSGTGAVYVFSGDTSTWSQFTEQSGGAIAGGALGSSVSIQGLRVASGAPHSTVSGKANTGITLVYTFDNVTSTWSHVSFRANGGQARNGSLFGTSVALDGSTIAVGAPGYRTGKPNSGTMFIFVNNGGAWTQQANLRPSNTANYFAGTSVAISGNTAVEGAPGHNALYVYQRTGTAWSLTTTNGLLGPSGFGTSVAVNGAFVFGGAPGAGSGSISEFGFDTITSTYLPLGNATGENASDQFGASLSVNSGRVLVGAPANTDVGGSVGNAYVYTFQVPSTTSITGFVNPGDFSTDSLTGVAYNVYFHVDGGLAGIPTGTVDVDDSAGGTCSMTLDLSGDGACSIISNFFGTLTIKASYQGDLNFSPSSGSHDHTITGNNFQFNPGTPADVLQGTELTNIAAPLPGSMTVELHNGVGAVITSDSSTQVTITAVDTCNNVDTIATVTLNQGVADLNGLGPKFYTVTAGGGTLNLTATQASPILPAPQAAIGTSGGFDVLANLDILYTDGFEDLTCPAL